MEKDKMQKLVQYEELQPDECINWSLQSYEDDISSEEDGVEEPVSKWIIRKERKRSPQEDPDQQMVKDLIINIKQQESTQQSIKQHHSMDTIIEESFKNIMIPIISGPNNYSGISDPSNSQVSFQIYLYNLF